MAGFNAGDVVKLKSGGPSLTVVKNAGGTEKCLWFDSQNFKFKIILPSPKPLRSHKPARVTASTLLSSCAQREFILLAQRGRTCKREQGCREPGDPAPERGTRL